ncbi:MAG: hypothetical protein QNK37_31740 [Acidobacteriota bacterium]|nr:hypothetical protein [Acidobacteriota bacterium]
MTKQGWIDWCQKQLADLSTRLFRQGYHPARVAWLVEHQPEFRRRYHGFLEEMDVLMEEMTANPAGYHHFDAFSRLKMDLLQFTNLNRARFLDLDLAA